MKIHSIKIKQFFMIYQIACYQGAQKWSLEQVRRDIADDRNRC